jgi:hypothetical protein
MVPHYISNDKKKCFFFFLKKIRFVLQGVDYGWVLVISVYFTEMKKRYSGNKLKIIYFVPAWQQDVKKFARHFFKLLTNLIS